MRNMKEKGSPWHDRLGRLSRPGDSSCKSKYFKDGTRERIGGGLTDKHDTGRGKKPNSGKGKYRCKDDSELREIISETINDVFSGFLEGKDGPVKKLVLQILKTMENELKKKEYLAQARQHRLEQAAKKKLQETEPQNPDVKKKLEQYQDFQQRQYAKEKEKLKKQFA